MSRELQANEGELISGLGGRGGKCHKYLESDLKDRRRSEEGALMPKAPKQADHRRLLDAHGGGAGGVRARVATIPILRTGTERI